MAFWDSNVLCEEEIEQLWKRTVFEVAEIEALYERFKYLDRPNAGFLTFLEFQMIPEFHSNPFSRLIINYLEKLNAFEKITFASFLEFLSIFNIKTCRNKRIEFVFQLFDLDKNQKITRENLMEIYNMMFKDVSISSANMHVEDLLQQYDRNQKGYLDYDDFELLYLSDDKIEKNMLLDISRFTKTSQDYKDMLNMLWPFKTDE